MIGRLCFLGQRVELWNDDRQRPRFVLEVESVVTIVIGNLAPLDEHVDNLRPKIERIARRDEEVRELALRDRPDVLLSAEYLGRPDRECLERGVRRKPVRNGKRRVEGHVSCVRTAARRERELYARLVE